ncbi:MAG TPA: DUF1444 family protein [Tepidisphaeraceae bacterium]|nr:DUF1444 family protein [Tepidisphaeraceae bacterium]
MSSEMSREQFVQRVIEHVRVKFPLVKLARGDQTFSMNVNGNLAPLENLYRVSLLRPEDLERHVDRWMVELLRASEGTPDQSGDYDEIKDRILPMVLASATTELKTDAMVTQPLIDGLIIAYALDSDRTISYIPRALFNDWKMSIDDLHEVAINNLVARSEAINAHAAQDENGAINLILFQTMDGYDASRILLPTLHERLREHLGSPFAAGIPNRDILLCFRDDEETVNRLKSQIAEDFRSMPHQVTDRLLLVTQDGIAARA